MTEAAAAGEQKTPEQQREALQRLAFKFEAEEKGEQAKEAAEGEYIAADESGPGHGPAPMPDIDAGPLLAGLFGLTSEMLAARRGEHWEFTDKECNELGARTSAVIDHYFPDMSMGPGGALVLSAGIIVGPRLLADRKASRKKRQKEPAPQAAQYNEDDD